MGNYMFCSRPLARSPLYIDSVHLNIYSLEELCYFLSQTPALGSEIINDERVLAWLVNECALEGVKRAYDKIDEDEGPTSQKLMWLFTRSHYFSEKELRVLEAKAMAVDVMSEAERQKSKGDELVRHGKYKKGISCYESISFDDIEEDEVGKFKAAIYNNIGTAYAKMFQGAKALEFFYKAYECERSWEYLSACLFAAYFDGGEEEMASAAMKLGIQKTQLTPLLKRLHDIKPYPKPKDEDKAIDEWVRAYHVSVDQ